MHIHIRTHADTHTPVPFLPGNYIRFSSRAAGGSVVDAGVIRARPRARACSTGPRQPKRERRAIREEQRQAGVVGTRRKASQESRDRQMDREANPATGTDKDRGSVRPRSQVVQGNSVRSVIPALRR